MTNASSVYFRYIDIPEPVREVLSLWRPSPLIRASRWEKALGLPANVKIFYKYEGVSPSGSHKTNTAVPQAFYNKEAGTKKITTETGAGQWGSALAWSGVQFDIPIEVYQVKVSYEQKPYRKAFIESCGASIHPSPSPKTAFGAKVLEDDPASPGSLGIAISEAIEACVTSPNGEAKYALGSVLSHVLMHQTVIGQEAIEQLAIAGEYPDVVVGCTGCARALSLRPLLGRRRRLAEHTAETRCLASLRVLCLPHSARLPLLASALLAAAAPTLPASRSPSSASCCGARRPRRRASSRWSRLHAPRSPRGFTPTILATRRR